MESRVRFERLKELVGGRVARPREGWQTWWFRTRLHLSVSETGRVRAPNVELPVYPFAGGLVAVEATGVVRELFEATVPMALVDPGDELRRYMEVVVEGRVDWNMSPDQWIVATYAGTARRWGEVNAVWYARVGPGGWKMWVGTRGKVVRLRTSWYPSYRVFMGAGTDLRWGMGLTVVGSSATPADLFPVCGVKRMMDKMGGGEA